MYASRRIVGLPVGLLPVSPLKEDLFRFELTNGPTGLTGNPFQRGHFKSNRDTPLKIKIDAESGFA
jgi:hypothetical protein